MITNFNTNFLLVWIFRVNCGQSGHGQSGQTRNLMREKVLKIVYKNNKLFIYSIFRREKYFQKSSLTTLTMTTLTTFVLFPKLQCRATDIIRKIQGLRIPHILSNLRHYLLPFCPVLLNKSFYK